MYLVTCDLRTAQLLSWLQKDMDIGGETEENLFQLATGMCNEPAG